MHIVVAGAGGFLGGHLLPALRHTGHTVTQLVRRAPRDAAEAAWNPDAGVLPASALHDADAVINLCGAGVGDRRWTARRREILRSSRLNPTALLASACARHHVPVLLNASAVGFYGPRGNATLTEDDAPGDSFLAGLCVDWEAATAPAAAAGVRVAHLRTGLVLGPDGGMLPRLATLTRMGLGGRLGPGTQYWPWISIVDHLAAIDFLLRKRVSGPVNLTAPKPVTNAEFAAELGRVLHRPTPWAVPKIALRAVLGDFSGEIVTGQRALPAVLQQHGFTFLQRQLGTTLEAFARR